MVGALIPCLLAALLPGYDAEHFDHRALVSTRIFASDGSVLYEQRSAEGGYGRWVALDQIPRSLIDATLASEDANFRFHPGIDPLAIGRAAWLNLHEGRAAYGGSTITQQLAKLIAPQPRTLVGKIYEAVDAFRIERSLSKDEILVQYLNRAYYGRLAYGVEAAAQRFFGKRAMDLRLDEAVLLATLPRAPSAYNPARHPQRAMERRRHVLSLMVERSMVSAEQAEQAAAQPIVLIDPAQHPRARHVLDYLSANALIPRGEPRVQTSLDVELQERVETRVRMHVEDMQDRALSQAGVVVIDNRSAEVLAMVGSRLYGELEVSGAVNATTAERHPGSALKPFVYALAFEAGGQPSMPVLDTPTEWRDYHPRAIDRHYRGVVSARVALGSSLNIPAVRIAERAGLADLTRLLRSAGLTTIDSDPNRHGLSLALGSAPTRLLDLAAAYSIFARGGIYRRPSLARGAPIEEHRVLSEGVAFLVTDVLSDPQARRAEFGLETPLELPFETAVKTGTSQSFCDNVVIGYTPEVTVAVWVGNFDGSAMHSVLSMDGAAPLFRDVMLAAMEGRIRHRFRRPDGVDDVVVCPLSGQPVGPHCPHGRRDLMVGARPSECDWHHAEGLRVPPDPSARWLGGPESQELVEILSPADGATFVVDPVLSRESQGIPLRAAAMGATRMRFEVDGRPVGESSTAPFRVFWEPVGGPHRLVVVARIGDADVTSELAFSVRDEQWER